MNTETSNSTNSAVKEILDELAYLVVQEHEMVAEDNAQIGVGGGGEVFSMTLRRSGKEDLRVAAKCIWTKGAPGDRRHFAARFARELHVWAALMHSNVLPLLGFYLSDDYATAQLFSPLMPNGNVKQYIVRGSLDYAARFKLLADITAGVDFLHNHHPPICHGDLKPANVLVSSHGNAMLCDFGLASLMAETVDQSTGLTTSQSIKGTPRYMSPELLLGSSEKHCLRSDIWGWACTAYEILTDQPPYASAKSAVQVIIAMDRQQRPGEMELLERCSKLSHATGMLLSRDIAVRVNPTILQAWSFSPSGRPEIRSIWKEILVLSDVSRFGSLSRRVAAHISTSINPGPENLRGLHELHGTVCVKVNGLCQEEFCCNDLSQGLHLSKSLVIDMPAARDMIVFEVKCHYIFEDGQASRCILGRAALNVQDVLRSSSNIAVPEYKHTFQFENAAIQSQVNLTIRLSLTPLPISFRVPRSYASVLEDDGLVDLGAISSMSSGARTFHSARSHLSLSPEAERLSMRIPGGSWDFYR